MAENRVTARPSVLIVEDQSHRLEGHFPNRFAELADAFAAIGVHVEVLTSRGWVLEGQRARSWPLRLYTRPSRWIVGRLEALVNRPRGTRNPLGTAAALLLQIIAMLEVRIARRRLPRPCGTIVLNATTIPHMVCLLGGYAPCVLHIFSKPRPRPVLRWLAALRGRRDHLFVAVPNASWAADVSRELPGARCGELPLAGARTVACVDRADAKQRLGLRDDLPVALLIGGGHSEQDPATVCEAFRDLSAWHLVIAGKICERIDETRLAAWGTPYTLFRGFVSYEVRELLVAASSLVVLSFVSPYDRNSGTLMDAVAHGRPVVVSSGSKAAAIVTDLGIGRVFQAGSPTDLARTLESIDVLSFDQSLAKSLAALGNEGVARRHLDVMFGDAKPGVINLGLGHP